MQTYARELVRELPAVGAGELAAVVQSDVAASLPPGVEAIARPVCDGFRRTYEGLRSVGPADLVHGLDVDLPARKTAAWVTTVHDLALFDVPGAFSRTRTWGKRATTTAAVRRADAVIAVSAFTAERVRARFGRDSIVVHEAPASDLAPPAPAAVEAVRARHGLPGRFVLHVGNLEPRKDVPTLATACREAGVPLVLAGGAIATVDVPPGARHLGYVDAADLPALYAAATAVAYVSRYEGFGLPPLEAMACGGTVMATPVGALPDVHGGGIAFVPIGDAPAQAALLRELAHDGARRTELAAAGLLAARELTWRATARSTASVYRALGIGGAPPG